MIKTINMTKIYLSLLCLIVVSEAAWVRVWEDNFDWNGGVDLNKWDFDEGGGGWGKYQMMKIIEHSLVFSQFDRF